MDRRDLRRPLTVGWTVGRCLLVLAAQTSTQKNHNSVRGRFELFKESLIFCIPISIKKSRSSSSSSSAAGALAEAMVLAAPGRCSIISETSIERFLLVVVHKHYYLHDESNLFFEKFTNSSQQKTDTMRRASLGENVTKALTNYSHCSDAHRSPIHDNKENKLIK